MTDFYTMEKDILYLYQAFLTKLKLAKQDPTAANIFESVEAYDLLDQKLYGFVRIKMYALLQRHLPLEWKLWRRCAENYHRLAQLA